MQNFAVIYDVYGFFKCFTFERVLVVLVRWENLVALSGEVSSWVETMIAC